MSRLPPLFGAYLIVLPAGLLGPGSWGFAGGFGRRMEATGAWHYAAAKLTEA
ncbi:hypothetical protein P152DRAFT_462107 [Eremomyces bilateralis CBS 781.70]|uniref:Uncharacterized protein n=1 Tax=Eremomyces bilateralis CBS 781.70 TaxID=1392243 RepID=A0A6G1FT78_9PEZI|nr:uncharacterized protein P152DRAFT_462107 [Eremomyces bilateralis CBS 781.70]KAF1808879.1 hypothetical protein P152DRAFT_462107 [Eremomyces bilateralis CBS 781.70]